MVLQQTISSYTVWFYNRPSLCLLYGSTTDHLFDYRMVLQQTISSLTVWFYNRPSHGIPYAWFYNRPSHGILYTWFYNRPSHGIPYAWFYNRPSHRLFRCCCVTASHRCQHSSMVVYYRTSYGISCLVAGLLRPVRQDGCLKAILWNERTLSLCVCVTMVFSA